MFTAAQAPETRLEDARKGELISLAPFRRGRPGAKQHYSIPAPETLISPQPPLPAEEALVLI